MGGRKAVPESLLEELTIGESAWGAFTPAEARRDKRFRLARAHMPVPLASILEESPYQRRRITFDPDRFPKDAELLASVRRHGVLEPVYLERLPGKLGEPGRYRPIAGHRRLAAARAAGLETIDAILAQEGDDIPAFALAENLGHRDLTAYEKALSLASMKAESESLSLRGLAKRSGLPFGTVASLVGAYEKSTPALRRCFAGGMAPRAVQELQPVFRGMPESTQMKLATILGRASQGQAASFRRMVEGGLDPLSAARSAVGYAAEGGRRDQVTAEGLEPPPADAGTAVQRRRAPRRSQSQQQVPDAKDEGALRALASHTGVSVTVARRLTKAAHQAGTSHAALTLACAYAARGGDGKDSLALGIQAARSRRIASAVRTYLDTLQRVRALMAEEKDPAMADFMRTIFFGG